jgi:hypothetical protein
MSGEDVTFIESGADTSSSRATAAPGVERFLGAAGVPGRAGHQRHFGGARRRGRVHGAQRRDP